jgi:transposase
MKEVTLRMTQAQINRYHVIMKSLEGKMTVADAAAALGISERQVTRLRNGVRAEGAAFLIHKNTNRTPAHTATEEEKRKIVELYRGEKYLGANFLHYSELLEEHEGLSISRSTVHRALTEAGIESPKKRRRFKPHRSRKRKAKEGLLMQMDATPYEWFGGRAKFTLHGGIDDATGKITGAYMTKNECLHGYFETMRQTIEQNGVPISAYTDRHAIFRSPAADRLTIEDQLAGKQANDTQFGRAMKELGVNMIFARSAQAKGRIERLWETLQSRLVIELRIRNIKSEHDANAFLAEYIPKFNELFAVEPEQAEPAYSTLSPELDLELVLCVKESRTTDNGGVFSFNRKYFQITSGDVPGKAKVEVIASATRGLIVLYKGETHDVVPYIKPKKVKPEPRTERWVVPPADDHHWKSRYLDMPLYSSDLVDAEIHKMLNDIFLSKYA